jgi:3-oxoacyl-[acyl-carrier-protein] synthase III
VTGFVFPPLRPRIIRRHARIVATGSHLPPRVVSNAEIIAERGLAVTDAVLRKTLGVDRRHVAGDGVTDSDILAEAGRRCLQAAGVSVDELAHILVTRFLGDHVLPMTASLVQRKLGATVALHALDVEGGTNSFIHAVDLATRYISTTGGPDHRILLCSGGIHALPVSKTDPRIAFLFGDGAAAVLLAPSDEPHFLACYTYANHALFDAARTRTLKLTPDLFDRLSKRGDVSPLYDLYEMGNWKETADFYVEAARVTAERLLAEAGLRREDIDLCLVTENNGRLREMTLAALGFAESQSRSLIAETANTMTAMLPLLLDGTLPGLPRGTNIMLISHGEGASGGGLIYQV